MEINREYVDKRLSYLEQKNRVIPRWLILANLMLCCGYEIKLNFSSISDSKYMHLKKQNKQHVIRFGNHKPSKFYDYSHDISVDNTKKSFKRALKTIFKGEKQMSRRKRKLSKNEYIERKKLKSKLKEKNNNYNNCIPGVSIKLQYDQFGIDAFFRKFFYNSKGEQNR